MLMYKDDIKCTVDKQQVAILENAGWVTAKTKEANAAKEPKVEPKVEAKAEEKVAKTKKPAKRTVKKD